MYGKLMFYHIFTKIKLYQKVGRIDIFSLQSEWIEERKLFWT